MPIKMTIASVGGSAIEITGDTPNEIIKSAAFWNSLPVRCPICGNPLNFDYRKAQDKHDYYILVCEGEPQHQTNLGIKQDGKDTLYYKGDGMYTNPTDGKKTHSWSVWDGERNQRIGVLPGGDAPQPRPKSEVAESETDIETEGMPDESMNDNQMVVALLGVAKRMGFDRDDVEKGAQHYFKTDNLNTLEYAQVQALTERMRKRAEAAKQKA